jgi:DNA-binding CsgD family transcriptional regulator
MKKGQKKRPTKPKIDWHGKALEYQKMLSKGIVKNMAEIARIEGVSRARVTQIMNLLKNR